MSINGGPEVFQYIIQPEDSLWELADEFHTTQEDIMMVNPGLDPYNLMFNQVINIPGNAVTAQQYRRWRRYRRPYFYRPYRRYRRRFPYYRYR